MPRPVHFEIFASDPERATAFYTEVFGWQFNRWGAEPYWLVRTGEEGPGIDGACTMREGAAPTESSPVNGWVVTVDVPDVHDTVGRVEKAGGTVLGPVRPIPGVGWFTYVRDVDGNMLGVMQADESAG